MRIGRKLLSVLFNAKDGSVHAIFTANRTHKERESAMRRGLIVAEGRGPKLRYVITPKGLAMYEAWVSKQSAGRTLLVITDDML